MPDELLNKKLPFSLIAEQSLLGCILVDPECFAQIADLVGADDFYLEEHRQIFVAMRELFMTSKNIDVVTLIDTLVKRGIYSRSGGEDYIQTIASVVPTALNVRDYAKIVRDKNVLRMLIDACGDISDTAYSEQTEVAGILDTAQNRIFQIAQGRETKGFKPINDLIQDFYAKLKELAENGVNSQLVQTGFSGIDRTLVGMGPGNLVLIGARPGMGKTSFALNLATNIASSTGKQVCIFSLEMSAEEMASRLISSEAMVDSVAIRSGNLKADDWVKIAGATSKLSTCGILIDDTSDITVTAMKGKLRRVKNLGLVVIDYLQLMHSEMRIENRVNEVADISRSMKIMAKELGVPVICCAQLSRGPESRPNNKRPMLSDLRDSGAIEQDADVVMFLYRDDYYDTSKSVDDNAPATAEVIIAKNRHGSTGSIKMGWIGRFTKFRTIADELEPGK